MGHWSLWRRGGHRAEKLIALSRTPSADRMLLATTRFNHETWGENCAWRRLHSPTGCAYGVMKPISVEIPLNSRVLVVEMNNEANEIMGIGLVLNVPDPRENVPMYADRNYCCYTYIGKYRIDRSAFSAREKVIVEILEYLVFKNATHLKRGQGITAMPPRLVKHVAAKGMDLVAEVEGMFRARFHMPPTAPG